MAITIDKPEHAIPRYSPVCSFCRHLRGFRLCDAFGEAPIPLDIWEGRNDHRAPVEGDHGIQFKPLTPRDVDRGQG